MNAANQLTERERSVLAMLATSLTYSGIARELHLSINTVKGHVSRIFTKLDVTSRDEAVDRARASGLLPQSAERANEEMPFKALVMHSSDLITIVDGDRRLAWANPAYVEMLGELPDAHLGRPAWEIVHPDDRDRLGKIFAEVSTKPGASVTFECRLVHADGTWRRVEVKQVNRLDDPAVRGFVGTTRVMADR